MASRPLAIAMVLLCGCFSEGGADDGSGPDDDDSGSASESGDASSAGSNSVSETTAGSQSGSASTTTASTTDPSDETGPDDTGPVETGPDDTGVPACGDLGEPCCDEGCNQGACHEERCVVFAGAYAEPLSCGGCTDDASGPKMNIPPSYIDYLGGCGCPSGFAASDPLPTTSDYCPEDGVLHTPTALRTCAFADPPPSSDWGGVYVTSSADQCVVGENQCVVENSLTGSCACPPGIAEMVASTWGPCGAASADQPIEIHVCVPTAIDPISFAGAYQTHWLQDGMIECAAPNPWTGDCTCPGGFHGDPLRVTSPVQDNGGEIFFCVPS
ncbi:MAG TPA: hypothetical protein VG755_32575 [Nannocystaceae bacterium]|nr:hypothetical protein [Nannocystaceae bacterium]